MNKVSKEHITQVFVNMLLQAKLKVIDDSGKAAR